MSWVGTIQWNPKHLSNWVNRKHPAICRSQVDKYISERHRFILNQRICQRRSRRSYHFHLLKRIRPRNFTDRWFERSPNSSHSRPGLPLTAVTGWSTCSPSLIWRLSKKTEAFHRRDFANKPRTERPTTPTRRSKYGKDIVVDVLRILKPTGKANLLPRTGSLKPRREEVLQGHSPSPTSGHTQLSPSQVRRAGSRLATTLRRPYFSKIP